MKQLKTLTLFLIVLLGLHNASNSQTATRENLRIPDILGYKTLKCDFHMHSVFSDGSVWPTVRIDEAWLNGLDAIAITDHIEYTPHEEDIRQNFNRPYEIALPRAEALGIILIRACEITRSMPPGHLNAMFLSDVESLDREEWEDAVKAASEQGAFIFWNHPGWQKQQEDGVAKLSPIHIELINSDRLHGIEVVNSNEYYPEAFEFGLEYNLTLFSNSDVHAPIGMTYDMASGERRPMTLVFARTRTVPAIRKALFNQRTVTYWNNNLYGEEKYLRPIFNKSVTIKNPLVELTKKSRKYIQIFNDSDINYELKLNGHVEEITVPHDITLYARKTVLFQIRGKSEDLRGRKRIRIPYTIQNLHISPDELLPIEIELNVIFKEIES